MADLSKKFNLLVEPGELVVPGHPGRLDLRTADVATVKKLVKEGKLKGFVELKEKEAQAALPEKS